MIRFFEGYYLPPWKTSLSTKLFTENNEVIHRLVRQAKLLTEETFIDQFEVHESGDI
jgi:hypothetical protein